MPSAREIFFPIDEALNNGRLDEARNWRDTLRQEPKDPIALTLLGRIAAAEGDVVGGLAYIGEAIRVEPYYEPAYRFRAELFFAIGQPDRAIQDMESLLIYYPVKSDLVANYAELAMRVGRLEHASEFLARASRRNPSSGFFANLSGLVRQSANDLESAATYYRKAIELDPNNAHFYNNLGTVVHKFDRFEEAQALLEQSLRINPNFEMAWYNLGNVLKDNRRFAEAEQCYRKAIELRPDYPDARLNLGCILIQQNRWEEGWRQYEYRWRVPNLLAQPDSNLPRWTGENLSGKHLIVLAEQGIGDTLQFVRYLPQAAALGARITFVCPPEVAALMSRFHPDIKVTSNANFAQYGGYWAPLMSLPPLLSANPAAIPPAPYLEVEEDRVKYYLGKLGKRTKNKLRIGIIWGGNPKQQDDGHRSADLQKLKALFEMNNVRWISLQKGHHATELANSGLPIEDWSEELDDYDETAACMQALDGVVSVCSSPLHLAGALGVRSIGMLHWAADWRWGLGGEETPWYPSVKLLRQDSQLDWEGLAKKIVAEIKTWKPLNQPKAESEDTIRRPAPTVRAKTHYGIMDLLRNDSYITSSLASFGEYCQDEINLLARYIKLGDTVIEAGGNVGAHTLPTARLVGEEGRLITFEPQYEAFRLLSRNVKRAKLNQVELHRKALSDKCEAMYLPDVDYRTINNFGSVVLTSDPSAGEAIEAVTIDSLKLENCHLIKLDVEGAEPAALEGARETIERFRPLLYIEEQFSPASDKLRSQLRNLGYRLYRHRALITAGTALPTSKYAQVYKEWSASCFAVPEELDQPAELLQYDD